MTGCSGAASVGVGLWDGVIVGAVAPVVATAVPVEAGMTAD